MQVKLEGKGIFQIVQGVDGAARIEGVEHRPGPTMQEDHWIGHVLNQQTGQEILWGWPNGGEPTIMAHGMAHAEYVKPEALEWKA
jgi:hypothetical protein